MNEEHRAERIHLLNLQLQALALSEREADPTHLNTVSIIFEARGELLRWEEWGSELFRKFPARVSIRTMELLVGAYYRELKALPLYRAWASDPDITQIEGSLQSRDRMESALRLIWIEALGRSTVFPGLVELQAALQDWDALAERLIESSVLKAVRRDLPPS